MSSPAEDIAILNDFWIEELPSNPLERSDALHRAEEAMTDLVSSAHFGGDARSALARAAILEKALLPTSVARERDALIVADGMTWNRGPGEVRLILLRGIYDAATGGIWGAEDPSGITEWIRGEASGREAVISALGTDPDPKVRAALLKIVRDVALPASWFAPLLQDRLFERIAVQVKEADWSAAERRVVGSLAEQAAGRVGTELAKLATANLSALPGFVAGDGAKVPTVPPPRKPAYKSGWTWLGGVMGLIGGAYYARRR